MGFIFFKFWMLFAVIEFAWVGVVLRRFGSDLEEWRQSDSWQDKTVTSIIWIITLPMIAHIVYCLCRLAIFFFESFQRIQSYF